MDINEKLQEQIEGIRQRLCVVYHISEEEAFKQITESSFFRILSDGAANLLNDGVEANFLRFQNEIEYGRWDL